ncbi:SKG-like transmembrane protein [Glycomyces xiaoerkulensis]|uniref:SKG-like transmembrane protein n=1 Tax=Glycomyces xiaoerkulensis TaxID=2038139 RepID=UPI0018E4A6A0|nr:SKG-like transmembrane protein [Glycomyces xiaoerkulensis]
MRSQLAKAAFIAAAAALPIAVPAQAEEASAPQVHLHLKDHSDLALAWDGESAVLAEEGDEWSLVPVEALLDLGVHMIVHEPTGECLSAAPVEAGAAAAPVGLAECAEATQWTAEYEDVPSAQDWRFSTSEGHYLGVEGAAEAAGGAEVVVVDGPDGHAHEWVYTEVDSKKQKPPKTTPPTTAPPTTAPPTTAPPTTAPPTTAPPTTQPPTSTSPQESTPPAQPKLPTTGTGIAAGVGIAVLAIGAGVGILAWRRRLLGAEW